jgi:hypothetical protein
MPNDMLELGGIVEKNPRVDLAKVQEVLDLVAELRRHGIGFTSYNLESPYQRIRPKAPGSPRKR